MPSHSNTPRVQPTPAAPRGARGHGAAERGQDLQARVLRRYRDQSPVTALLSKALMTFVMAFCFLMAAAYVNQLSFLRLGPSLVFGALGLLIVGGYAIGNRRVSKEQIWRRKRGSIQRRRRGWFLRLVQGVQTCPYCHDDLECDEESLECPDCSAGYHAACLEELGCCASLGCDGLGASPRLGARRRAAEKVTLFPPKGTIS